MGGIIGGGICLIGDDCAEEDTSEAESVGAAIEGGGWSAADGTAEGLNIIGGA